MRQLDSMLTLLRLSETEEISQADFLVGLARLEKRAVFTWVSKLYQAEERRHRAPELRDEDRLVRDAALQSAVQLALADPDVTADQAKALVKQMADNVAGLETRLIDYEDTAQTFSPEDLPQAQADETNIWARFNAATPKFMDVVIDSSAPLRDQAFLEMASTMDKKLIEQLQEELTEARKYKHRFDAMVDELAAANTDEQKSLTPNTVNCINKNLVIANGVKKKTIAQLKRKLQHKENEVKIYQAYADGKISRTDLTTLIDKAQSEQNEFQMIRLRKIKVERAKQISEDAEGVGVVEVEGARMTQLRSMFRPSLHLQPQFLIDNKVQVLDWGNVDAIKAGLKDPSKIKEYMEELQRDRMGVDEAREALKEADPDDEEQKNKPQEKEPEPIVDTRPRANVEVKAKATLFRQPSRVDDGGEEEYDSEEEEEKELLAEQAAAKEKQEQAAGEAQAAEDAEAVAEAVASGVEPEAAR